mgnify:CR=1 FL=1|jgi:hypothetical protein
MSKTAVLEEKSEQAAEKSANNVNDEKKETGEKRRWTVRVENNPAFCGIGAGGVQFANGRAEITSGRMAEWFREHEGYKVD